MEYSLTVKTDFLNHSDSTESDMVSIIHSSPPNRPVSAQSVDGPFGHQPRTYDTSTLPNFALHLLIPLYYVFLDLHVTFPIPLKEWKGRQDIATRDPTKTTGLDMFDRVYSELVRNSKFLT